MRIPGRPFLPVPTFRTYDDAWVSLDTVVGRVCAELGGEVSPLVCRCTIQIARQALRERERVEMGPLATDVCHELRPENIVVTPVVVTAILMAYANELARLGVAQVAEGWERPG